MLKKKKFDRTNLHENANQKMIKENLLFFSFSGEWNSDIQHAENHAEKSKNQQQDFTIIKFESKRSNQVSL